MKKILTILFILFSVKSYSQDTIRTTPQFLGGAKTNVVVQGVLNLADSPRAAFNWLLKDTASAKLLFQANLKGRWARESGRLYYNPTGLRFVLADSVTGGGTSAVDSNLFATVTRLKDTAAVLRSLIGTGGLDTTSLSNRINQKVSYSDTSGMLIGYVRAARLGDTAAAIRATIPSVTGKVNYTDTSAMLSPYLRKADTASLSNRIDLKLNITDTANIRLRPIAGTNMTITGTYPNLTFASSAGGGAFYDSVLMATQYRLDTTRTNIYADLATKVKYSDTASMLSPYYRTATATAALALKANLASPTFTGTVTTPALTISSLTAGSTSDSVVTVNAATGVLYRRAFPSSGGSSGWGLTGNAGTTAGTNFVGTTDAQDLVFKTNSTEYGRIGASGGIAFGQSSTSGNFGLAFGAGSFSVGSAFALGNYARAEGADALALGVYARPNHGGAVVINTLFGSYAYSFAPYSFTVVASGGHKFKSVESADFVNIGVTASKAMEINSTTGMFVPPVMTAAQAEAISSKPTGGMVYSTTGTGATINAVGWWGWNGTTWEKLNP